MSGNYISAAPCSREYFLVILGYIGIMEKRMEITIVGYIRIIGGFIEVILTSSPQQ